MRPGIRQIGFSFAMAWFAGCSRPQGGSAGDTGRPRADGAVVRPDSDTIPVTPTPATATSATRSRKRAADPESTPARATSSTRPHLSKMTPSEGSLGSGAVITVTVSGSGLAPTGNRVFFGSIDLGELPSDGRTLRFSVPQTIPSRSEVPPMAVQPGRYDVHIENARGVSDSLVFTIRDSQD